MELVARLRHSLGDDALFTPRLADTWRPETAWQPDDPLHPSSPSLPSAPLDPVATQYAVEDERLQRRAEATRPTLMLTPPPRLSVALETGIPQRMESAERWWNIDHAFGPERLQGEWWRDDRGLDRDYWIVQTDQGQAWIYRERDQWFLQGWFD